MKKRINKKTPAVTKVDECTKADTGVGAAIAAGSQLLKGIWALLVIPAIIINKFTSIKPSKSHKHKIFQWPTTTNIETALKMKQSPTRFINTVNIPAAKDFLFW